MRNILELTYPELEQAVQAMGHQGFRARQLWHWLWRVVCDGWAATPSRA